MFDASVRLRWSSISKTLPETPRSRSTPSSTQLSPAISVAGWCGAGARGNAVRVTEPSGCRTVVAAGRAGGHDIAALRAALGRMAESAAEHYAAFAAADSHLHLALSAAARNRTLVDQLPVVRSLLRGYDERAVHDPEAARTAVAEHAQELEAIECADEDGAASAMAVHMATASVRLAAGAMNRTAPVIDASESPGSP